MRGALLQLLAGLCLLAALETAAAQPELQPLVITLTLNGEPRGEYFAYFGDAGDFFLKQADLRTFVTLPPEAAARTIEGEAYVELRSLSGAELAFDENTLTLALTLPAAVFPSKTYDLASTRRGRAPAAAGEGSALFNYQLGYAGNSTSDDGTWSLTTEQALRAGAWLARNQTGHLRNADGVESVRFFSQLQRDDRQNMRRLTLGDAATVPGTLGAGAQIGGVSFAKAYQVSPYFIRRPSVNFAGSVVLPSQVDFYVGDTRVLREQISPGPFEISNFAYYGGQRDVRVVIRDALGREQVIAYPYYFSDQGLSAGLQDYSYHLGFLREDFGAASDRYGDAAFSALHEYGFTDWFTAGLHSEGTADYGNLGASAILRHDRLGVLAAGAAASHDRDAGGGAAASLAYSYQAGEFAGAAAGRYFSTGYAMLRSDLSLEAPGKDGGLSLSYSPRRLGSFNLSLGFMETRAGGRSRSTGLGYSRSLLGKFNVFLSYRNIQADAAVLPSGVRADDELFLGVQYLPARDISVGASARRVSRDTYGTQVQAGNTLPTGEGLGYRLAVGRERDPVQTLDTLSPELRYNARHAVLSGQLRSASGTTGDSTTYLATVAGSVAMVAGRIGLTRPIQDSFALAEITPPLAGVRVYQNQQEVGRTGAGGTLFLPTVTSFVDNQISIDDTDVPIEYALDQAGQSVSPSFRSGAAVRFSVVRTQSFSGRLNYRSPGGLRPLEYHPVLLEVNGAAVNFQTGSDGEFYLENVPAGEHAARATLRGRWCGFTLVLPETTEPFVDLGEVLACDDAL